MSQNQCHRINVTESMSRNQAHNSGNDLSGLSGGIPSAEGTLKVPRTDYSHLFQILYTYWYFRDRTIYRHYIVFMCLLNQLLKPLLRHCPRVTTSDKHTSLFLYTFVLSHAVSSEKLMGNSHICSCRSINLFRHHNYTTSSET